MEVITANSSFILEPGRGGTNGKMLGAPTIIEHQLQREQALPQQSADALATTLKNNATSLHEHRQSHNSSKLPAFRFADLTGKNALSLPLPSLLHIPPSPVSPNPVPPANDCEGHETHQQPRPQAQTPPQQQANSPSDQRQNSSNITSPTDNTITAAVSVAATSSNTPQTEKSAPISVSQASPQYPKPIRTRASTFQTPTSASSARLSTVGRRPASFPDSPSTVSRIRESAATSTATTPAKPTSRRAPASHSTNGVATSSFPPPALSTQRLHAVEAQAAQAAAQAAETTTKVWAQGQRELLLPKTLQQSTTTPEERRVSASQRPPVSFRPPVNPSTPVHASIPPIRGFRSSGQRRSLILDMNYSRPLQAASYEPGDDVADPNQRDRTLRALEGRPVDDGLQMTPPDSAKNGADSGEDTTDMFLRIGREDSSQRENTAPEEQTVVSRVVRSTHRRPLSAAVPSSHITSPPRLSRRLSDQQETTRIRPFDETRTATLGRPLAYRTSLREKAVVTNPEEIGRARTSMTERPSPVTPRSLAFQESQSSEPSSAYGRRRGSLTESSVGVPARAPSYRQSNLAYGQSKAYNSSPLVPRTMDQRREASHISDASHGLEGTESTASTAAPSSVWDELDDLKSRIHRLELTGKLPATSGAAMSRVSDERPPTATTTVTTMSASPKRVSGKEAAPPEASSTTSSQREAQPILNAALSKTKGLLSTEVYKALESATADALALSSMMGTVGQPGPISSGASTIGGATGTVTDRQLRRKADSICRSLTELCIALADEAHAKMHASAAPAPREKDASSPTVVKGLAGVASQRRPSAVADQSLAKLNTATSPRSMTRLEERRTSMLAASALPSPRYAGSSLTPPSTTTTDVGRKSSLLLSRTRRAGTEEPPDEGRKSSLLRSRRAGTEEPPSVAATDEGRKTSLLLRGRRGTLGGNEADDEGAAGSPSLRAPSRAVTEVGRFREGVSPRYPAAQDTTALGSSALPRRRLVTSSLTSRLAAPSTAPGAGTVMSPRRFLDRSDGGDDKTAPQPQQAQQRHLSLGQTAMLNRAGSLNRRSIVSTLGAHNNISRDSTLTNASTTAQAGGYR